MTTDNHSTDVETTDWDVRPIQWSALALFVFIALGLGLSAATAKLVTHYRQQTDEPAVFGPKGLPPPPRLQIDEAADLANFKRRQAELLNHYAWVDREHGVVRLPIDRAMALTVQDAGTNRR